MKIYTYPLVINLIRTNSIPSIKRIHIQFPSQPLKESAMMVPILPIFLGYFTKPPPLPIVIGVDDFQSFADGVVVVSLE